MVSGLVTSPDDQSRICFEDASPMRIASKSLMSIKFFASPFLVLEFQIHEAGVAQRADCLLGFLCRRVAARLELDIVEIAERFVCRQGQLAVLIDALLPLLHFLRRRRTADGAQRAG